MDFISEPDLISTSSPLSKREDFGPNLLRIRVTNQIKELQTVIRDK